MAFSTTELYQIRKYCGYPQLGTVRGDAYGILYTTIYGQLNFLLSTISPEAENDIRTLYLPKLVILEEAIFDITDNLDTKQAAVYYWNENEISDRERLYKKARMMLCDVIGNWMGSPLYGPALVNNATRVCV